MTHHFVLIADLVHSRRVEDRPAFESRLEAALRRVRTLPGVDWHAPLEAVKGIDELSSVLLTPDRAFDVAWQVNLRVWPESFRFVLAHGEIDVGWETRRAGPMDGPAYHRAAAGITRARDDGLPFALDLPGVPSTQTAVVESLAHLHDTIVAEWSAREAEFVRAYDELGRQGDVAERFDVSQQAVSKALRRARDHELHDARRAIAAWLAAAETSILADDVR